MRTVSKSRELVKREGLGEVMIVAVTTIERVMTTTMLMQMAMITLTMVILLLQRIATVTTTAVSTMKTVWSLAVASGRCFGRSRGS